MPAPATPDLPAEAPAAEVIDCEELHPELPDMLAALAFSGVVFA